MSKDHAAGHYRRAGQGRRKRARRDAPPPELEAARPRELDEDQEDRPAPRPVRPAAVPVRQTTLSRMRLRSSTSALPTDYGYVKRDLARIGILTALFMGVLVALTFVFR